MGWEGGCEVGGYTCAEEEELMINFTNNKQSHVERIVPDCLGSFENLGQYFLSKQGNAYIFGFHSIQTFNNMRDRREEFPGCSYSLKSG